MKHRAHVQTARADTTDPSPSSVAARDAIVRYVLQQLRLGVWKPGDRLPTEMELKDQFFTTRSNANLAMKMLEEKGIVRRYRRRGSFAQAIPAAEIHEALAHVKPRTRRVHVIAPLDSSLSHMHWDGAALSQLEGVLNAQGMQMEHRGLGTYASVGEFAQLIRELAEEESRGLVLLVDMWQRNTIENGDELLAFIEPLLAYHQRICWYNRSGASLACWPYDAVSLSPLDEGLAVGYYLVQQQVPSVICVKGQRQWSQRRMAGVQLAMTHAKTDVPIAYFSLEADENKHCQLYDHLLDQVAAAKQSPTVVMPNDHFAAALLDRARERKLPCPERFNVIGFDNDDRYRAYNITTVAPPAGRIGQVIGQLMSDEDPRPGQLAVNLKLKSVVVERSTFATPSRVDHFAS